MWRKYLDFKLNKGRLIIAALGIAACFVMDAVMPESMLKFSIAVSLLFALGGIVDVKLKFKGAELIWLAAGEILSFACVVFTQLINNFPATLPVNKMLLGMEASLIFITVLGVLFFCLIRNKDAAAKTAIISGCLILMGLAVINFYTSNTRGKALCPSDINAVGTVVTVLDHYEFGVTARMWQAIMFFAAAFFLLTGIHTQAGKRWPSLVSSLLITAALLLHLNGALPSIVIEHYGNNGCKYNGLMLNLFGQLKQSIVITPENYSEEAIAALEDEYGQPRLQPEQKPDIIVIMNESFSDMRVWGELETNIPVMPFIDSLEENTVKGFAAVSIIGGVTPNSEYEFLLGNSLMLHPSSALPFEQYIKTDTYGIEHYLSAFDYTSYFTHPCPAISWSRDKVYPLLGFDEISFIEAYEGAEWIKGYISDRSVYKNLISNYDKNSAQPQFMFAVTMQNHSSYDEGVHFEEPVYLENIDFSEADVYLSCIHESDRALKELINYFETVDRPVVVMMFGDHHPKFSPELGKIIRGTDTEDIFQTNMAQYTVPFMIWANYDIEEKNVELTSLNFLSNYLLEAAGLPLSPYNSFLADVNEVIPAMNAFGYWSNARGGFAKYSEAEGEERHWLETYELLQYNSLFDKKGRSDVFFPVN